MGGVYAFCSKEKEGYLLFSFPISCVSLGFFCFLFLGGRGVVCVTPMVFLTVEFSPFVLI